MRHSEVARPVAKPPLMAEAMLMFAVLIDALRLIVSRSKRASQARAEALYWLMIDDHSHLHSAAVICEFFGVDIQALREVIRKRQALPRLRAINHNSEAGKSQQLRITDGGYWYPKAS